MRTLWALSVLCTVVVLLTPVARVHAADNAVVLYRIGDDAPQAWSFLKQYLEGKGHPVVFYQGEATIERHVEKVNALNRGPGTIFLAVELVPAQRTHVMVAMTIAKKGEGRFLTIDQIPDRFAAESEKLAGSVASPFNVKVKRLPLFPLLGVSMPGVFVRMQFKEDELEGAAAKLESGIESYFTERTIR